MKILKTLDKSLAILEYFKGKDKEWGVRELAKELDMSHSVVYRILTTFEKHGFLSQNKSNQKYRLGMKFWQYGLIIEDQINFRDLIQPSMDKLAYKVEETVYLTILNNLEGLSIGISHSDQSIKFDVTIGTRKPLYAGAANKVIMAFLPRDQQNEIIASGFQQYANNATSDSKELTASLTEIKKQGWSLTDSEYTKDVLGIAVPLFDNTNTIFGSLNVAGPKYRISDEKIQFILKELEKSRKEIQTYLNTLDINLSQLHNII